MKHVGLSLCALLMCALVVLAQDDAEKTPGKKAPAKAEKTVKKTEAKAPAGPLGTIKGKVSYGIGFNVGGSLTRDGLEIDLDLFIQGIKDALGEKDSKITQAEIREAFNAMAKELQAKKEAEEAKAGEVNQAAADKFLAENKTKEGVTTTKSGLQYEILKKGTGAKPKASDSVKVHYHGTLLDGTVFDSSVDRKMPATFGVGQVIKGWVEGLQLMPVGSKWKLFIPPDLAYGTRGSGAKIGANSALIFEVELLEIQ
ncbi:MAG: FKBP-type peptidyl-prolyl cis-trans isomerase [Planctomycetota bacterium]|nr:FKBP-type peptidyl-prolyl cis-trans isomerase [Planctomycetota bacterium]